MGAFLAGDAAIVAGGVPDDRAAAGPRVLALEELGAPAAGPDDVAGVELNGGLGTSMGLTLPKSLVPVRPPLTFLDVIARQVLAALLLAGASATAGVAKIVVRTKVS